jgi:GT2 family glycosyltransferase
MHDRGSNAVADADLVAVTVTLNGLPWIERCLESLSGLDVIVVDHGSTDGTMELVRERFPEVRLIEQENNGYGAGLNTGFRASSPRYWLVINSDAWVVVDAVDRLVAFADAHPDAAVVAPRLRNPDGSLQRSVRGFPTLWRLATEYFFLRKLAPRSHALNAFYAGDFDHGSARAVDWVMGSCFLVRRAAADQVGLFDEDFFLFSEETDWLYRFHEAGWSVWFTPDAEAVHVGGATHGGRMFVENVRGHVRWFAKHHGPREAARARRLLLVALRLRGLVFRGERGRMYREAARAL